jgi:hypothetical protein
MRRAMVNLAREPLRGEVQVDDTWVGGTQLVYGEAGNLKVAKRCWSWSRWKNEAAQLGVPAWQ